MNYFIELHCKGEVFYLRPNVIQSIASDGGQGSRLSTENGGECCVDESPLEILTVLADRVVSLRNKAWRALEACDYTEEVQSAKPDEEILVDEGY